MEETRSFGYVCPKCGKAVVAQRSKFALSAAAVRMECPKCGGVGAGGTDRRRALSAVGTLRPVRRGTSGGVQRSGAAGGPWHRLACPETKQLCCYAGRREPGDGLDGGAGHPSGQGTLRAARHSPTTSSCMRCCRVEGHGRPERCKVYLRQPGLRHPHPPGCRGSDLPGLRREAAASGGYG